MSDLTTLGGPGSGNFGHAGRPGEVGGSAPSGTAEISQADRDVMLSYTQTGGIYSVINDLLRGKQSFEGDSAERKEAREVLAIVDRTFANHAEPVTDTLYRGISGYDPEELGLEVGREFKDLGFVSTSRDKAKAAVFARAGEQKLSGEAVGIVFRISPRGALGLRMDSFSRYDEHETLLNRGTRFKVTRVKNGVPGEKLAEVSLTVLK